MIVALFGDAHGNLPGLYQLCAEWEAETGRRVDLALQVGDMELWRTPEELKKADPRRRGVDDSVFGSAPYLSGEKPVPVETWFVHGNNENFGRLREAAGGGIDPAGRLVFLAPGTVREFRTGDETITVAGCGGMEYRFGKYPIPDEQPVHKYIYPPALEALEGERPAVDVLLLHEAPMNKGLRDKFPTGSKRITRLIEALAPRFAFYGHYDRPPEPFRIGRTLCACLNPEAGRKIPGRDGGMGVMDTESWEFGYVKG